MGGIQYQTVLVDELGPPVFKVRMHEDPEFLADLGVSLKAEGMLAPIGVLSKRGGKYPTVFGNQRRVAAKRMGINQVPIVVLDIDDARAIELAFIENEKRKDLSSAEREAAVTAMWESGRFKSRGDLAKTLGISKGWVEGLLSSQTDRVTLKIPEDVSTTTIQDTAGLDPKSRMDLIEATRQAKISKDAHVVRDVASVVKKAPEPARPALVKAIAKGVPLPVAAKMVPAVEKAEEVEDLVEEFTKHGETELNKTLGFVRREKDAGRKPVVREVIKGDVKEWDAVLESFRTGAGTIMSIRPASLKTMAVRYAKQMLSGIDELAAHLADMRHFLEGPGDRGD